MLKPNEKMIFKNWGNSVRHPIVIYANFECLLKKLPQTAGGEDKNTKITQDHIPMSYGFYVKASSDVPMELLKEHQIMTDPVIFRGKESTDIHEVAKNVMTALVSEGLKIEQLLKTNIPIKMTDEHF